MGVESLRLEDVAKIADVSISTVSRVVNGIPTVNDATRKRVLKALETANYYPNLQARSLVVGHTNIIGVIVSNLLNPFFVDVFHAIEHDARKYGYEVLVANTDYDPEYLAAHIRLMIGRRVAGIALVVSEELPPVINELLKAGIPTAVYDVGATYKGITNVRFDNRKGMSQIVEYLTSLGHRRIAYIGVWSSLLPTDDRKLVFAERSKEYGIEAKYFNVALRGNELEGARAAVREVKESKFEPTAIVCVNDIMAIGVLRELREHGISVPDDISVTGFDNIEFSEFTSPSLTTIDIPREEIGHKMFSAIVPGRDHKVGTVDNYLLRPELVVRESTGVARSLSSSARGRLRKNPHRKLIDK